MLIDVLASKDRILLARVEGVQADTYLVRYLSPTKDTAAGLPVFRWEKETYTVEHGSVSGFYDTLDLSAAGYTTLEDGTIVKDDDSEDEDYIPSDSDETESSEESYVESDAD
jgi:hypothetical protein